MTNWIATRTLTTDSGAVIVRLGAPSDVPNEEWQCAVEIDVGELHLRRKSHGEDAFQALGLGLELIRVELEKLGATTTWLASGDHGFPRLVPALSLEFTKRANAALDREVEAWSHEQRRRHEAAMQATP